MLYFIKEKKTKIIQTGATHKIFPSDIQTHDQLPAGTYRIEFDPMAGYSLIKVHDIEPIETKIYGAHDAKIAKISRVYDTMDRSTGVILSGERGMGKSLFLQLVNHKFNQKGIPTIICDNDTPGLEIYLDSIEQEVVVLFDEFEKKFNKDGQSRLLGLFDGTSNQKRLYMVTVNEVNHVSPYMFNRPGRFHYHIQFEYPTIEEATQYLEDKVNAEYHKNIADVINIIEYNPLNYDCLRAVALELNFGLEIKDIIDDLNIDISTTITGTVICTDSTGERFEGVRVIDMTANTDTCEVYNKSGRNIDVKLDLNELKANYRDGKYHAADCTIVYSEFDELANNNDNNKPLSLDKAEEVNKPEIGKIDVQFRPYKLSTKKQLL